MITPSRIISILIVDKLVKSKTMGVGLIFERMSDSQVSLVMILMVSPRSLKLQALIPIGILKHTPLESKIAL